MTLVFGVWYFKILDFQEMKYSLSLKQTLYFQHILKHKWSALFIFMQKSSCPFYSHVHNSFPQNCSQRGLSFIQLKPPKVHRIS